MSKCERGASNRKASEPRVALRTGRAHTRRLTDRIRETSACHMIPVGMFWGQIFLASELPSKWIHWTWWATAPRRIQKLQIENPRRSRPSRRPRPTIDGQRRLDSRTGQDLWPSRHRWTRPSSRLTFSVAWYLPVTRPLNFTSIAFSTLERSHSLWPA